MGTNSKKLPQKTQADKFIETAKALGCDDDEAAFKAKLRRVAAVKVEPVAVKKPKKKKV